MAQALPDTDVFNIPDVSVTPLPIDPRTWELVNEILGYPPRSSTRVNEFWGAIIQAAPITRDDGSVMRSALFPRPARSLHRLVSTAAPNQLYSGQLTLTMSTREWYPSQYRQANSGSVINGFERRDDANRNPEPCRAHLVIENLRALPTSCCTTLDVDPFERILKLFRIYL